MSRSPSGQLDFLKEMLKELPDTKFVLDFKQSVRANVPVIDMIELLKGNIIHIHLSDHDENGDCLPPFRGNCNYAFILERLRTYGFKGQFIIELYRNNFDEIGDLLKSIATFNRYFPEIV